MKEDQVNRDEAPAEEAASAEQKSNRKIPAAKIFVAAAILIAIAAIWLVKNGGALRIGAEQNATPVQTGQISEEGTGNGEDTDFLLEAEAIDMAALLTYHLPIIIDFGSDSCIPCQQMAPVLKSANEDYQGRAIIKFVDVWKYTDAADNFPVQVIPTQVFIGADGRPYVPGKDLGIEFGFYSTKETGEHVFTVHQGGLTREQMEKILADMGAGE